MTQPAGAEPLAETEIAMLALEHERWKYPGAKETAIHERFGLSATLYYRALHHLIDRPEALAHDPLLVKRLRRMRDGRRRARSAERLRRIGAEG